VRKVALAVFLFVFGFACLAAGIGVWYSGGGGDDAASGGDSSSSSRGTATALLVLGSVAFLPGAYMSRLAYLAWRGVEGYSFNDIPDV
jgi:hypothetical protein